eukprot:14626517-Alexandrium_andersonii.AAC.1
MAAREEERQQDWSLASGLWSPDAQSRRSAARISTLEMRRYVAHLRALFAGSMAASPRQGL